MTSQGTADGGTLWTVTSAGGKQARFHVHPDGYLALWERETMVPTANAGDVGAPIDEAIISYRPVDDPPSIPVPEVGSLLDVTAFGLAEGFLRGNSMLLWKARLAEWGRRP